MTQPFETKSATGPNCRRCSFYYVTWEPSTPHGCRAIGFKSQYLPNLQVFRTSGSHCQYYHPKPRRLPKDID
ncbi:MAG: uracil-DNA glycosylase [Deltaproteobacteria bacterium]|nr:uracil-DNA glycosylase [Deltaproteobacteria bacterium]